MNPILAKIGDFDIVSTFEEKLHEMATEFGLGYFTADVDHDEKGVKVILQVAAMVDTAGENDFKTNKDLKSIEIEFPDGIITYDVEDVVPVSGMEIQVVYRPREKIKKVKPQEF